MKNESNPQPVPVTIIFTSNAWLVFRHPEDRVPVVATHSGQQLVDLANGHRWAIQNKLNLVPALRSQLLY